MTSETITVRLLKANGRTADWPHDDRFSANRRANSLSFLHGDAPTEYIEEDGAKIILVDARRYYGEKI